MKTKTYALWEGNDRVATVSAASPGAALRDHYGARLASQGTGAGARHGKLTDGTNVSAFTVVTRAYYGRGEERRQRLGGAR